MIWITVSCHVAIEESSLERGVSFVHHNSQRCSTEHCAETCCGEKCLASRKNQACFWFLAKQEDDAFDDER